MDQKQSLHRDRLIIFGRYPVPGEVKTRLIPALGRVGAAELQRLLTEKTLKTARAFAWRKGIDVAICYDGSTEARMRRWLGRDALYSRQSSADLGDRMEAAFDRAFQSGCDRTVLVGTDIPGLTQGSLEEAFRWLDKKDMVLGPSTDGGYWLVGLKRRADVFRDIGWGGREVLEKTLARAESQGLTVHLLDLLTDIDTVEDLKKLMPEWMEAKPYISVIIPALNEAVNIEAAIDRAKDPEAEIIVADGGSADDTCERALRAGARLIRSPRGRAVQQNLGAASAKGKVFLFLHADTRVPENYLDQVFDTFVDPKTVMGAFLFKTDLDQPRMKVIEALVNFRSRVFKMPYGDQGLFVRRLWFEKMGGFPRVPIAEDLSLVKQIKKRGLVTIAPVAAVTSGRRWEEVGIIRATFLNQIVLMGLALGISSHTLARLYRCAMR